MALTLCLWVATFPWAQNQRRKTLVCLSGFTDKPKVVSSLKTMTDELENQDSLIPEQETEDSSNLEQPDDAEKLTKLEEANKQLFARAKKAEEEAKTLKSLKEEKPPVPQNVDINELVAAKFEERDLESLELSDEIKGETKAYAKAKGISIREASKSEYIKFLSEKESDKVREVDASASTKSTGKSAKRDFSSLGDEGITKLDDEEFGKYKEWLKSQE